MFLGQTHFDALISVGNALIMHRRSELLNLHSFERIKTCILKVSFYLSSLVILISCILSSHFHLTILRKLLTQLPTRRNIFLVNNLSAQLIFPSSLIFFVFHQPLVKEFRLYFSNITVWSSHYRLKMKNILLNLNKSNHPLLDKKLYFLFQQEVNLQKTFSTVIKILYLL